MPRLRGSRPDVGSPNFMLGVAAFVGLVLVAFGLLNSFHVHGWRSYAMAIVAAALLLGVARAVVRRITAATERERHDWRSSAVGSRAERRQRARRIK